MARAKRGMWPHSEVSASPLKNAALSSSRSIAFCIADRTSTSSNGGLDAVNVGLVFSQCPSRILTSSGLELARASTCSSDRPGANALLPVRSAATRAAASGMMNSLMPSR